VWVGTMSIYHEPSWGLTRGWAARCPTPLESIATIFPLPFPWTASVKEIKVGRGVMGPVTVPQRRRMGCKGAILVDIPWS
jgi:hypothetical protein